MADRHRWSALWRAAAEGSGITRTAHLAAGQTAIVSPLVAVADNPDEPLARVVHVLPGQLPADVAAVADRLAPALGALRVRVVALSDGRHVRLELLDVDPVAELRAQDPSGPPGLLGLRENGDPLAIPWHRRGHALVQGQTGSGKSVWTYSHGPWVVEWAVDVSRRPAWRPGRRSASSPRPRVPGRAGPD